MRNKFTILIVLSLSLVFTATAQPPQKPRAPRPPEAKGEHHSEWFDRADTNKNGTVERSEFDTDAERIFKDLDKNNDGVLDQSERFNAPPPRAREEMPDDFMPDGAPGRRHHSPPSPFLMEGGSEEGKLTRPEFFENAQRHFAAMDKNNDGAISRDEAEAMDEMMHERAPEGHGGGFRPAHAGEGFRPPVVSAPTAEFLGAEMRFGDKSVKGAPFSAETVMESTRRLFDGSTVTSQNKGAIYRDSTGRTRREQTLETVGGFSLGAEAQRLVFITDAAENTQYFLDAARKIAHRLPLEDNNRATQPAKSGSEKTESLGTKIIEGVSAEGTKTTIEIPAFIGSDKTVQIVSERWYSPELQTVVMTRHVDPLMGEQIFRLTNIKRSEPARELFIVPSDYKVEGRREDKPKN